MRSGWIPALLVYAVAALMLASAGNISIRDIVVFTLYLGWVHAIPGAVLWRALGWHRRVDATETSILDDLTLGTALGIVVSVPVYVLAVVAGVPQLVLAWPLLVLVPAAFRLRGRHIRRPWGTTRGFRWWHWALAAVLLYLVLWSAQHEWASRALSTASLRAPYIDEPYHLALLGEFRYHFPAEVPYVDGTPLRYHWLVYPFMAMATWGTGIDAVTILRLLVPVALGALILLGTAAAAARISGQRWAGVAAALFVCLIGPPDVMGWTPGDAPWISTAWVAYDSPTQVLASALAPLLVVMIVAVLRREATGPLHWLSLALVMLAVAGAKSAMFLLVIAGLCAASVIMVLVNRRKAWPVAGLALLSLAVFALATVVFYGHASRDLSFGPFQVADFQAGSINFVDAEGHASTMTRISLTVTYVLLVAVSMVGGVGLFVRRGWRDPVAWVLAVCGLASIGAVILLSHPHLSQLYFRQSGVVPIAIFAASGWARLAIPRNRATAGLVTFACVFGFVWGVTVSMVTSGSPPAESAPTVAARLFVSFGLPLALGLLGAPVVAVLYLVISRKWSALRGRTVLVMVSTLIGMCAIAPVARLPQLSLGPAPPPVAGVPTIGDDGIQAAEWLHDHSAPDDLVATNVHARSPLRKTPDYRDFWISAYAQRHILVEGWAYIPAAVVGLPSSADAERDVDTFFWDPALLRQNDEAIAHPTAQKLAALHQKYGVDWLFVDTRRPADLAALSALADRRFRTPDYWVFRLRDTP